MCVLFVCSRRALTLHTWLLCLRDPFRQHILPGVIAQAGRHSSGWPRTQARIALRQKCPGLQAAAGPDHDGCGCGHSPELQPRTQSQCPSPAHWANPGRTRTLRESPRSNLPLRGLKLLSVPGSAQGHLREDAADLPRLSPPGCLCPLSCFLVLLRNHRGYLLSDPLHNNDSMALPGLGCRDFWGGGAPLPLPLSSRTGRLPSYRPETGF